MTNILLSSNGNEVLFTILAVVWSVLCIILFFKVWGMTNDVKRILDILSIQAGLEEKENVSHKNDAPRPSTQPKRKRVNNTDSDKDSLMYFYDDCTKLYKSCKSKDEFEIQVDIIIDDYLKTKGKDFSYLKDGLWTQLKQL